MYLIFDTETSGMPLRDNPEWGVVHALDAPGQPRLVQLGLLLVDENLQEQAELCLLVDPAGTVFDDKSREVHGISEERAARYGLPLDVVLDVFDRLVAKSSVLVAHNIEFDQKILAIQYAKAGRKNPLLNMAEEDTMFLSKEECGIPNRRGDGLKAPTLSEAYKHFTGEKLDKAHDALADCRACLEIFRALKAPPSEKQGSLF